MTKNIMIVGVGGQGSLLASKMLGKLLLAQGYDVKVSEVHGRASAAAAWSLMCVMGSMCILRSSSRERQT